MKRLFLFFGFSIMLSCGAFRTQDVNLQSKETTAAKTSFQNSVSNLERIKMATVVTQNIDTTKALYRDYLNYRVVEEGKLSEALANSWGTSKMTGKPYALLQSESGDDVYLRVIQGTVPES